LRIERVIETLSDLLGGYGAGAEPAPRPDLAPAPG
jgi:hypothetical protein